MFCVMWSMSVTFAWLFDCSTRRSTKRMEQVSQFFRERQPDKLVVLLSYWGTILRMHSHAAKNNIKSNNWTSKHTPCPRQVSTTQCFMWCDLLGCFDGSTWSWRNIKCPNAKEWKRHLNFSNKPSKHAGSNSHWVWISWEASAKSGPDESWHSCTVSCFWTGSIWLKSDTVSQN